MNKAFLLLAIIAAFIVLSGCSDSTVIDKSNDPSDVTKPVQDTSISSEAFSEEDEPGYTMIYHDDGSSDIIYNSEPTPIVVYDPTDRKYDEQVILCDTHLVSGMALGTLNYSKLSDSLKIDCSPVQLLNNDMLLKIMAGDSDVDIYILGAAELKKLLNAGIHSEIDSDAIKSFNSECFDYIKDFTLDENGNTFAMPVFSYVSGLVYFDDTASEAGFTRDDLLYYDSMIDFIKSYKGSRNAYSSGINFFWNLESQYEYYYCDFENKKFNYMTDTYKKIYSILDGWKRYSQDSQPVYFKNDYTVNFIKNSDKILFYEYSLSRLMDTAYTTINGTKDGINMGFMSESALDGLLTIEEFGKLRIAPMPKIDETIDKNLITVKFAYINPYSKNKDNAIKVLEEIANNYFDYGGADPYSFIFDDVKAYPDYYLTDSQLFTDAYEICSNGYINPYQIPTLHNDIEEFQNGRATLEEAIAMYQREVNIWLNE